MSPSERDEACKPVLAKDLPDIFRIPSDYEHNSATAVQRSDGVMVYALGHTVVLKPTDRVGVLK